MHWYMVELRSEKTIESTLHRLGISIPAIFREAAIELFIPVSKRDLNLFELNTGNYLYVRSKDFRKLLRLKTITGIVGLATYGDSNHPSQAIKVENTFVQEQIAMAEAEWMNRASTIVVGSFVRIIDGDMRDWCGGVTHVHDGTAVVRVDLKTKFLLVETPVRNLLDKSDVPNNLRVFYYGDLVEGLAAEGLDYLVAEDLTFEEDPGYVDDGLEAPAPTRHSRQQTVTALVKRLIVTGNHDPRSIGIEVLAALKAGSLKRPKNLSIVHGIIKSRLILDYYRLLDPSIANYRQVVEKFGSECRFSLNDLAALCTEIDLPLTTEGDPTLDDEEVTADSTTNI
jgi:hypothetical protein